MISIKKILYYSKQRILGLFKAKPKNQQLTMTLKIDQNTLIELPQLKDSFRMLPYDSSKDEIWVEFLNQSKQFGKWSTIKLHKEILDHVIPNCVILITNSTKVIGCGALCKLSRVSKTLTLMYMLVDEKQRGQNIGKFILESLLNNAKNQGFTNIRLYTDDYRLSAIALYLKTGFLPDFKHTPDAKERWNKIMKELGYRGN